MRQSKRGKREGFRYIERVERERRREIEREKERDACRLRENDREIEID